MTRLFTLVGNWLLGFAFVLVLLTPSEPAFKMAGVFGLFVLSEGVRDWVDRSGISANRAVFWAGFVSAFTACALVAGIRTPPNSGAYVFLWEFALMFSMSGIGAGALLTWILTVTDYSLKRFLFACPAIEYGHLLSRIMVMATVVIFGALGTSCLFFSADAGCAHVLFREMPLVSGRVATLLLWFTIGGFDSYMLMIIIVGTFPPEGRWCRAARRCGRCVASCVLGVWSALLVLIWVPGWVVTAPSWATFELPDVPPLPVHSAAWL